MNPSDFARILFEVAEVLDLEVGPLFDAGEGDLLAAAKAVGVRYEEREGHALEGRHGRSSWRSWCRRGGTSRIMDERGR
jgi:hypothetical protein